MATVSRDMGRGTYQGQSSLNFLLLILDHLHVIHRFTLFNLLCRGYAGKSSETRDVMKHSGKKSVGRSLKYAMGISLNEELMELMQIS